MIYALQLFVFQQKHRLQINDFQAFTKHSTCNIPFSYCKKLQCVTQAKSTVATFLKGLATLLLQRKIQTNHYKPLNNNTL